MEHNRHLSQIDFVRNGADWDSHKLIFGFGFHSSSRGFYSCSSGYTNSKCPPRPNLPRFGGKFCSINESEASPLSENQPRPGAKRTGTVEGLVAVDDVIENIADKTKIPIIWSPVCLALCSCCRTQPDPSMLSARNADPFDPMRAWETVSRGF